jgi:hypothetical protein
MLLMTVSVPVANGYVAMVSRDRRDKEELSAIMSAVNFLECEPVDCQDCEYCCEQP